MVFCYTLVEAGLGIFLVVIRVRSGEGRRVEERFFKMGEEGGIVFYFVIVCTGWIKARRVCVYMVKVGLICTLYSVYTSSLDVSSRSELRLS